MSDLLQPDPGYDWRCQRCHHQWRSSKPDMPPPKQCAGCRTAYWQEPKKPKAVRGKRNKVVQFLEVMPEIGPCHPLLQPPPHMRNQRYNPPEPEPTPENMIRSEVEAPVDLADVIAEEDETRS